MEAQIGQLRTRMITPERAEQMLRAHNYNSGCDPYSVRAKAKMMRDGRWRFNPRAEIKIDRAGRLIEGRHRLRAVVAAYRTIKCVVREGLPEYPYDELPAWRMVRAAGFPHSVEMAGLAKRLLREEISGGPFGHRQEVSTSQIVARVKADAQLREAAIAYRRYEWCTEFLSPGLLSYCWYKFHKMDAKRAATFFAKFERGTLLGENSPIYRGRAGLMKLRAKRGRRSFRTQAKMLALVVKAWTMHLAGAKVSGAFCVGSYPYRSILKVLNVA